MKKNIKVAIIGAGNMAREHIKVFKDIKNVEICGIFSRTIKKAKILSSEYNIKHQCNSISQLYKKTEAHLVIIAVSELATKDICEISFQFPWECLIEKPVGYNLAETENILTMAKNLNRSAFIALNRRHYSSTIAVKKDADTFTSKRLVHVYDQESPSIVKKNGWPTLVVDNWRYANSIHLVDYFQIFCRGELVNVENIVSWKPHVPCFVIAKLTYSSGDLGIYEAIWEGPGPWAVTITTKEKRWELKPLEEAKSLNWNSRNAVLIKQDKWDLDFKPGLRRQAEETIKAILGQPHSLPNLEDGLNSSKLIQQIYES